MKTLAVLLVLACGCKDSPCDKYADRVAECSPSLPDGVRGQIHGYCVVSTAYEPEPGDGSNNLAALTKRAIQACSPTLACTDFLACLEQQGCRLLTSVNAPSEFSFQCWPTPPPVTLP